MQIKIKETNEILTMPRYGRSSEDFSRDLIGNHGGLIDGQFIAEEDDDGLMTGLYIASAATFQWWALLIPALNHAEARLAQLPLEIQQKISDSGALNVDLEDLPLAISNAIMAYA